MLQAYAFTYGAATAAPTLASASPNLGDTAGGGQLVTLIGTNFTGATGVTFGGTAATSVTVVNATTITCIPPAHASGAVSVVVTTAAGSNGANTAFEYWTPAQATGVDVYLDANKGVTAAAGAVGTWTDQSAHAVAFTQATGANKPTQTANVFGTLPSIRFVPQQWLSTTKRTLASGLSMFFVGQWTSTRSAATSFNAPLTAIADVAGDYNTFGASAGVISYSAYDSAGATQHFTTRGSALNTGTPKLIGVTADTAPNEKLYVGATQQGATNSPGVGWPAGAGYDSIGVGFSSVDGWNGDIGAVVIISGVISAGDIGKLNTWAQQRFGTP